MPNREPGTNNDCAAIVHYLLFDQARYVQGILLTLLSKMRAGQTTWGRRVLSAFVVAWISAVMQPCLMAMEISAPDDVTISAEHSLSDHAEKHSCPHCPPSSSHADQMSVQSADCGELPDYNQGDRFSKLELDKTWLPVFASEAYVHALPVPADRLFEREISNSTYPGDPPLNLKNCVFLK